MEHCAESSFGFLAKTAKCEVVVVGVVGVEVDNWGQNWRRKWRGKIGLGTGRKGVASGGNREGMKKGKGQNEEDEDGGKRREGDGGRRRRRKDEERTRRGRRGHAHGGETLISRSESDRRERGERESD